MPHLFCCAIKMTLLCKTYFKPLFKPFPVLNNQKEPWCDINVNASIMLFLI